MKPIVSVIIPTYNRAALVQRAIESVLAQTHDGIEVIVVDDGSNDGSAERLGLRYGDDARVTSIATDHRGAAAARNVGLTAVSGSHVAFLDSDDAWYQWKLQFQLECLDAVPEAGMIWSDMAAADPDGVLVAPRHIRTLYRRHREIRLTDVMKARSVTPPGSESVSLWWGDLYPTMIHGNLVHTSTVLLTRERLEAVGGFDESLVETGEDFDFHLRTCRAGPVAFVDVPTTVWRKGAPDQLTRPDLMVQMARNYVATIEKAKRDDPGRLSERELTKALAGAHGWLGEELLEAGSAPEARLHLRGALRGRHRIRTTALLLLSRLPMGVREPVRRALASITRPFRRRSAG